MDDTQKNKMEKHLEFIQGVINRHNSNSFMLKGWTITITAAIFALAGTVKEPDIMLIALMPTFLFWGLDAFYLSNERCFVDLYNAVAEGSFKLPKTNMFKKEFIKDSGDIETDIIPDYNMNFKRFKIWKDNHWLNVVKSKTIFWFYVPLAVITILMMVLFTNLNTSSDKPLDVNATIKSSELDLKVTTEPPTIINNVYPLINPEDTELSTNEESTE